MKTVLHTDDVRLFVYKCALHYSIGSIMTSVNEITCQSNNYFWECTVISTGMCNFHVDSWYCQV